MSNEVLAIIIAIIIMVPAILFYEFIVIRNYADKFLPPTVLSLFSNGEPRNLNKKNEIVSKDSVLLNQRIRDLHIIDDNLFLFLESTGTIAVFDLKKLS